MIDEFSPKICYIEGKKNIGADFMSRNFLIETIKNSNKSEIEYYHNLLIHPGSKRLYNTIKKICPEITIKEIEKYTDSCNGCQVNKKSNQKYGNLQGTLEYFVPWETVAIDIMGPLQTEEENNKIYVLHFLSLGSRFCQLEVLKNCTSKQVTKIFENKWLEVFPIPKHVLTDNGKQFIS